MTESGIHFVVVAVVAAAAAAAVVAAAVVAAAVVAVVAAVVAAVVVVAAAAGCVATWVPELVHLWARHKENETNHSLDKFRSIKVKFTIHLRHELSLHSEHGARQ